MKKFTVLLTWALCLSLLLGAIPAMAVAEEPVTIRILTRLSSNQPNAVAFRERVAEFMALNPHITVEDLSIEDEDSYNSKLSTAVGTGDVPELFATYGGASFINYAQNNVALDLTEALNADPAWRDTFLPVFENFQFDTLDGTYAVPYEFFAIAMFYNQELFEQIGATPPTTIEEFEAVADKFLEAGIVPMALGEKEAWRGGHLIANLIDKKLGAESNAQIANRTLAYNAPEMVELFALISDWNTKGYFGDAAVSVDHTAEKAMFHSGQTAMHINGSWYVPEAAESAIVDKIGVVPFPYFADAPQYKDVWMGGAGGAFAISGTASPEKQAAAIELLKFVTNKEAFEHYQKVQKGGIFPVAIASDPSVVDRLTIEYSDLLTEANFKAEVYSYDILPQMQDTVRNEIQGLFAGQTPQQTADNIQAVIDNAP